jgi:hypothetical protein
VFALQCVLAAAEGEPRKSVAQYAGFPLHVGTAVESELCDRALPALCGRLEVIASIED